MELLIVVKKRKQLSVHPLMDKQNMVLSLQQNYYWAVKRNEVLTHTIAWRNLEKLRVNEINQAQTATYLTIPLIWKVQNRQICTNEK